MYTPLFHICSDPLEPLVIAGPCSAESREQTLATARLLNDMGIRVFRAGVWKPRTKPGGFEGRGAIALDWLREVRETTGMQTVTEIAVPRHLEEAVAAGIDGVWIGARTAANPFAVQELSDALASLPENTKNNLTVLVKNPVNPDLELWIGAIQRVQGAGLRRLGAIHRGFSSYGKHLYRNQPRWAIPFELSRRMPGLPVIFDPSHVAGRADLVGALSRQAANMNYAGLMIETHCSPEDALSDSAQQVTPAQLKEIIASLDRRTGQGSEEALGELREKIDRIDDEIIDLLARRMEISREIGACKKERGIPVIQPHRYRQLMEKRVADGERLGLSPDFTRALLALIHEESVKQQ